MCPLLPFIHGRALFVCGVFLSVGGSIRFVALYAAKVD